MDQAERDYKAFLEMDITKDQRMVVLGRLYELSKLRVDLAIQIMTHVGRRPVGPVAPGTVATMLKAEPYKPGGHVVATVGVK